MKSRCSCFHFVNHQRVRTVSTESPSRRRPTGLELRLECLVNRERVIATRARDGAVLAFPFSTPLKLDGITPPWNIIPSLVTPLYPLVNTSMCMKGLSAITLPYKAMKAVPQPKKAVLDEWLKSQEGKSYFRLRLLSDWLRRQQITCDERVDLEGGGWKCKCRICGIVFYTTLSYTPPSFIANTALINPISFIRSPLLQFVKMTR